MIVLGILLLLIGFIAKTPILLSIGIVRAGHRAHPPSPWGDGPRDRRTEALPLSRWS